MLKNKTFLAFTLALGTLGAMSVHADDRLLEKTPYGWYYSRTIRVDGRITAIERSGEDYVLRLDNGEWARLVAHDGVDVRIGNDKDAKVWDLRQGDVVRVIGRPGANGTMFPRRIDVTSERPRRRR
ncbi:MAG TPA: hypothetical protein VHW00_13235 [Thermoanaerobaculia bacterium]|nr:hypothetical protein [Thermoanaerobaculia bacterium]